ncbi:hypothetical protein EDD15DRAFT_2582430 [Pisolithus albus]|nr:hypothetical protein EDD15DRAFT_2582430 [Pisolithus albus]
MVYYRVFLGAPPASDLAKDPSSYVWKTTESSSTSLPLPYAPPHDPTLVYPTATLDEASRRISLLYQNIIFKDTDENEDGDEERIDDIRPVGGETQDDATTFLTWPPTPAATQPSKKSVNATSAPSFLLTSQSQPHVGTYETQETAYSDENTSSVTRFPNFQFSLHTVTSLASLHSTLCGQDQVQRRQKNSLKVNVLVAILEVEGPDTIKVKTGPRAGQEVSILKLILGDEEGCVCRLTAWRDTAEVWGGYGMDSDSPPAITRGDVVYFESEHHHHHLNHYPLPPSPLPPPHRCIPPSRSQICYRTLPTTRTDARLRPDLRLGCSDVAVRRVGVLVRWFEDVAGVGRP